MPPKRNPAKRHIRAHRGNIGSRQALIEWPASGCDLPIPEIPNRRDWSDSEQSRWEELWHSPQAVQWDDSARGTVAALVLYESALFSGTASAWQAQESRYAADALGLTPKALTALGGRIVE